MIQEIPLTRRQEDILQTIVKTHITTASAVGSRTVAREIGYPLSPASVRNVMADLEEMGCVRQPHTSAGRIPTEVGYRIYVNALMETYDVEPEQQLWIDRVYRSRIEQIEELFDLSTKLLSMATHYTAVAQTPATATETIRHVDFVPLDARKVVAVVVTHTGEVKKRISTLPEDATDREIRRIAAFANEKLCSLTFSEARALLDSTGDSACPEDEKLGGVVMILLDDVLSEDAARDVFLDGIENIFDQPEFADINMLRPVLSVFDKKRYLNELLGYCVPEDEAADVCIRIGSENPLDGVRSCSVVASPYRVDGRTLGVIAVVGPTRMEYSRACALVAFVAERLGGVLTEMCGG
jgi:heat-inducible transcriptional repressor